MSLILDIEENLPIPLIYQLNASINVPVHRIGNFYSDKIGPGCGTICIWNGGGYYMETFKCGKTYPSGKTFYCCSDCHVKIGDSQKVFLSYRWCDKEIADKISRCLQVEKIDVFRDIDKINFHDAISAFMNTAAESRYFIAIMSESYFYSRNCMYELCQISQSNQQIRTIPIVLGDFMQPNIEHLLVQYWKDKLATIENRISKIHKKYTLYLQSELDLLNSILIILAKFFKLWHEKDRPEYKKWLLCNCLYLIGAIKTTYRPTNEDALNWTYSNKAIRLERIEDSAPKTKWKPQPFFLHALNREQSTKITKQGHLQKFIKSVYFEGVFDKNLSEGVHLVLINASTLKSLQMCLLLQYLLNCRDATLVPIFLDKTFYQPTSETTILLFWHDRLLSIDNSSERVKIENMLLNFGTMVEALRDIFVPADELLKD